MAHRAPATTAGTRRPDRATTPPARLRWPERAVLALLPVGCALAALAIGQDANFDLLNYHAFDPYAFLHNSLAVDVIPASLQSYLNPLIDVPFYALMTHVPPRFEAAIVGAVQGLNLVLVACIARRATGSRLLALAATIAAGVAGGFASELGNSMGDTIVSIPVLAGVWCALVAIERGSATPGARPGQARRHRTRRDAVGHDDARRAETWWWAAAGALAGLGVGLKLSELEVCVGLVVAAGAVAGSWRDRLRRLLVTGLADLAGLLATAGYWTVHLWLTYHDPLVFDASSNALFPTPYLPAAAAQGRGFLPANLFQALVYPLYWFVHPLAVAEIPLRELSIPLAYVLTAALVVVVVARAILRTARAGARWARRSAPGAAGAAPDPLPASRADDHVAAQADRFFLVLFGVSLAIWTKQLGVYRYLMPVETLAPLVIWAAARRLSLLAAERRGGVPGRASRRRRALAASFVVACTACAATAYPASYWLRVPFGTRFFTVPTPPLLQGRRPDAVLQVSEQPLAFVYTVLPSRIIAVGYLGNILDPTYIRLADDAVRRAVGAGGSVLVDFVGSYGPGLRVPPGTSAYLAELGLGRLAPDACDIDRAHVGAAPFYLTFCRLGPPPPARPSPRAARGHGAPPRARAAPPSAGRPSPS